MSTDLRSQITRLQEALAAAEAEIQRRGYVCRRAVERAEKTEAELVETRAAYEHIKTCMHTAEERASNAERDLSALQDTDAELLTAYNAKHAEVTRLTEERDEARTQSIHWAELNQSLSNEVTRLKEALAVAEAERGVRKAKRKEE